MAIEVLLSMAAAVVGLFGALFHGWVFALHRPARDHLWVAVAAAGAAAVSLGAAGMYAAEDPAGLARPQSLQAAGGVVATLGFLRFAARRFGLAAPRRLRAADVFCSALALAVLIAPELIYAVDAPPRRIERFGIAFEQLELTPLARGLLAPVLLLFFAPLALGLRALRRGAAPRGLVATFAAWTAIGLSDTAVGLGLYDLPYVMATGGYSALVAGLSLLLLRELVQAADDAEALGARLHEHALARADALRAVELLLARGEQLSAIGTLAAGVAHEINNPLAYVSANLNELERLFEARGKAPEADEAGELEELLTDCRDGLARVRSISADLLRMARQDAGDDAPFDLVEVVRSVLPVVDRESAGRARLDAALAGPLRVRGNPRLVGQAALNLLSNAVQAASSCAGREPRIEVRARRQGGGAELVVRDNGPGIPEALLERIFEPAFTTKAPGSGTGLGLALTRLIVTRHGGAIRAESSGDGTSVILWLPCAPPEAAA